MKKKYLIILIALILLAFVLGCLVFVSPCGEHPRLEKVIQIAGVFVALIVAVIALSAADPERKSVKVSIKPSVDKRDVGRYRKKELSDDLRNEYKDFPDPVESYKVQFTITNVSGFALKNPTWTFRLPLQQQHPHKVGEIYSKRTFNSNLFNSQRELRLLEFADTIILSNSNLPYWNDQDVLIIWIRMALHRGDSKKFVVEVSVNCENAEGMNKKLELIPSELLS